MPTIRSSFVTAALLVIRLVMVFFLSKPLQSLHHLPYHHYHYHRLLLSGLSSRSGRKNNSNNNIIVDGWIQQQQQQYVQALAVCCGSLSCRSIVDRIGAIFDQPHGPAVTTLLWQRGISLYTPISLTRRVVNFKTMSRSIHSTWKKLLGTRCGVSCACSRLPLR
jgi:hypothetical protein